MQRAIREYGRFVAAILTFMVIAAVAGTYILIHQRLRTPFESRYTLNVDFPNSESLTPGLGQPVNVAGVRVGDIDSATLKNGRSTVKLSIDPGKLPRVYANAQAVLRPNTALKDMQIEITPGGRPAPVLPHGGTIPVTQTNVPIDTDMFTGALDTDTRAYFDALVAASEQGLAHRGRALRAFIRTLAPTSAQIRAISDALAARRVELTRLVHNLAILAQAAGRKDKQLGQVVAAGDATFNALASQDAALRDSLSQLPGTLGAARRSLSHLTGFADQLGPTLTSLQPAVRRLPRALRATGTLVTKAEPLVRTQLRPFVHEAQPLARDLAPTTHDLSGQTPDLTSSFQVLNYVANELVYNPPGSDEGYLFWLAWFTQNGASLLSTGDAHGSVWRGLGLVSCSSITSQPQLAPVLEAIAGLAPTCPPAP